MENKKLTTNEDWERLMGVGDEKKVNKVVFSRVFNKILKKSSGKALEIGCIPGNFLIYICKNFGYKPVGLDYLKDTFNIMKNSFYKNKIEDYEIYKEDFLKWRSPEKYELVSSFGFIEHFNNPESIVKKHIALLKEKGILILEVPNFLGVRGTIAKIVDIEFYNKHNTLTMTPDFYNKISKKYKLRILYLGYYGGFAYYPYNKKMKIIQKIIYFPIRILGKVTKNIPTKNKHLSSYLIFIGQKIKNNEF